MIIMFLTYTFIYIYIYLNIIYVFCNHFFFNFMCADFFKFREKKEQEQSIRERLGFYRSKNKSVTKQTYRVYFFFIRVFKFKCFN